MTCSVKDEHPYLEIAIIHTAKHFMPPQFLLRNPRTRDAERDSSQEPRIIADSSSREDSSDFLTVDTASALLGIGIGELDAGVRLAEGAVVATFGGHGSVVGEMAGEGAAEAGGGGDEVDDALDALHVGFLSGLDLRVDGGDDVVLGGFA